MKLFRWDPDTPTYGLFYNFSGKYKDKNKDNSNNTSLESHASNFGFIVGCYSIGTGYDGSSNGLASGVSLCQSPNAFNENPYYYFLFSNPTSGTNINITVIITPLGN
jgi:hypothetical protein